MEVIRLITNGYPQGIYAVTNKEEVTDIFLDMINKDPENETYKSMLETHLDTGLSFIPKEEKPFDWNNNIHGEFIK